MPQSAYCAYVFHTFCPSTTHSSPSRTARVPSDGEVGAGARLAEQLAPQLVAAQHRVEVALLLLVGAVHHERGRDHADPDR